MRNVGGGRKTVWPRYRKYLEFLKRSFQSQIAFRADTLLSMVGSVIWLFAQVAIWRALLSGPVADVGTTVREMVSYVVVSALVGAVTRSSLLMSVECAVCYGDIGTMLLRPMSMKITMIAEDLGSTLFLLVLRIVPILALGILLLGMQGPYSAVRLALFVCALVGGAAVSISLNYTIGLFAFWFTHLWHAHMILGALVSLFSGSVVPLWFFPRALSVIAEWLPFRSIYYVPITIYLGRMGIADSLLAIAQQPLWVAVLYGLEKVLWARGVRRVVVQGG